VSVPLREVAGFLGAVGQAVRGACPGGRAVVFGHIGDGNLHVNVLGAAAHDDAADDAVLRLVIGLGGSISAEHGIGTAKARWLPLVRAAGEIGAMRAVKSALDPGWILSPNVLFPPETQGVER
jgi:FAD/FMN-containing dehydrogenase